MTTTPETGTAPPTYRTDTVKPFCPCDTGRPQDCKPEEWPGAHAEPPCLGCGEKRYRHFGWPRYCARPADWPLPSTRLTPDNPAA